MPLFLIALIVLVAIFGFWDTLGAIVGGVAVLIILTLLVGGLAAWAGIRALKQRSGRIRP